MGLSEEKLDRLHAMGGRVTTVAEFLGETPAETAFMERPQSSQMPVSRAVLSNLLVCAVRYALPRHTYVVAEAEEWINAFATQMLSNDFVTMYRDIETALARDDRLRETGKRDLHDCDRDVWQRVRAKMRAFAEGDADAFGTAKPALRVGDVVQIDPAHDEVFGGAFMIITEPKAWGAQGFVPMGTHMMKDETGEERPAARQAPYRCPHDAMVLIGRAEWSTGEEDDTEDE